MKLAVLPLMMFCGVGLSACGGGSDETTAPPTPTTATFNFQISDAPVDGATAVVVCFNSIELTGNGLGTQKYLIGSDAVAAAPNTECKNAQGQVIANTRGVDLMKLPGSLAEALVSGATVPAGNYGQLRLVLTDGSYIQLKDGSRAALTVPSNELKLNGPVLSAGGTFSYTLEFDLRKAVVATSGNRGYQLKPTGLRLVDTSQIGHLKGNVSETLLLNAACPLAPRENRLPVAAVYLYKGGNLAVDTLGDNGGVAPNLPYASAPVKYDGASLYQYEIGFVDAGTYTAAVTCQLTDEPEQADPLTFLQTKTVTVTVGKQAQQLDF